MIPLAILIYLLSLLFYRYLKNGHRYWTKRNVASFSNTNIIFGNTWRLLFGLEHFTDLHKKIYEEAADKKCLGYYSFHRPMLFLKDPDLIRNVLARDFDHFQDRGLDLYSKNEPLTHHMFNLEYDRWKPLRKQLVPAFTAAKIKSMLVFIKECCAILEKRCNDSVISDDCVEIKDLMARFTTDVISSCAFGVATDSLTKPDAEFRKMGARIFKPRLEIFLRLLLKDSFPSVIDVLGLRFFERQVTDFFYKSVADVISYRESNRVTRGDFLDLLMAMKKADKLNNTSDDNDDNNSVNCVEMSLDMITAQCFIFFAAGFETSSSTISFCLLELARNPRVLFKAQNEVDRIFEEHDNELTYESLQKLTYLEMVVLETLRMYPPLYMLSRKCTMDYTIPGTQMTIEKGTEISIPVYSLHHDPQYFPNPEVFDPEHFLPDRKSSRHPFCYLPFGEGPRICIGLKFGMMQTKLAIATLLQKYDIELSEKTTFPLEFIKASFVTNNVGGIWLKFAKRKTGYGDAT